MAKDKEETKVAAEETAAAEEAKPAEPTEEDKLKRLAAEYDNFRKRTAKERDELYKYATCDTVLKFLDFVDDFERAKEAPCADENYKKGIELVSKKLDECFKALKIEEIPTDGGFNPDLHNAIMHEEDPEKPENTVGEVLRKGYTCDGKVVRHALVKVIN